MRRPIIGLITLSLLASCGSSGRAAQPEDDFLDDVEGACRTASKAIRKLDFGAADAGEGNRFVDLLATMVDDIKDLDPPPSLAKDFDRFVASIDDQVSEGSKLVTAIDDADTAATDDAVAGLTEVSADADNAADSLGALRCRSLVPADGFTTSDTIPVDTIPSDTIPVDTIPVDTIPVDTVPVETIPVETIPVDTVPVDTTPIDTTPIDTTPTTTGAEIYPSDLSLTASPPDGYFWVDDYEQSDASGLYEKSILGPLVTSYSAARAENIADGHTASIFVITLSETWTPNAVTQYLVWEAVENGTDVTSPGGLPVRQELLAFEDTDCIAYYAESMGVSLCTYMGIDGLPILDAFIAAQGG